MFPLAVAFIPVLIWVVIGAVGVGGTIAIIKSGDEIGEGVKDGVKNGLTVGIVLAAAIWLLGRKK